MQRQNQETQGDMEPNLVRDVENYKKGLFRYIRQKRQTKKSVLHLISEKEKRKKKDRQRKKRKLQQTWSQEISSDCKSRMNLRPRHETEYVQVDGAVHFRVLKELEGALGCLI